MPGAGYAQSFGNETQTTVPAPTTKRTTELAVNNYREKVRSRSAEELEVAAAYTKVFFSYESIRGSNTQTDLYRIGEGNYNVEIVAAQYAQPWKLPVEFLYKASLQYHYAADADHRWEVWCGNTLTQKCEMRASFPTAEQALAFIQMDVAMVCVSLRGTGADRFMVIPSVQPPLPPESSDG